MSMYTFKELLELPGAPQERAWLEERLEMLSVWEQYVLAAVSVQCPAKNAADVINGLQNLSGYKVRLAGSDEELGRLSFQCMEAPEAVLPYVDLERLGRQYRDAHPGVFVGNCYVEYAAEPPRTVYFGLAPGLPEDSGWSARVKLASPAVPEGVWLRLPDFPEAEGASEIDLVLDALQVPDLESCTLLDARCILPEAGDLMAQYRDVQELIEDGNALGCVMDEQGQGEAHWRKRFAAALEYEDCHTLKFALDISQNLRCYDWMPLDAVKLFAHDQLYMRLVPRELLDSGCIDLTSYGEALLRNFGYTRNSGGTGFILRNTQQFLYEYSTPAPEESGLTMG